MPITFQNALRVFPMILKARHVVYIHGAPGGGKSALVESVGELIAKNTGKPCPVVNRRLALNEPTDLAGYPTPNATDKVMDFLAPRFLPREGFDTEQGILFLDEINRAQIDTQNAAFQLILDKVCGDYKLPAGWMIMCAGNLGDEDQTIVKETDSALNNRMMHFLLKPDHKEWVEYMGADKEVAAFITTKNQFFMGTPKAGAYNTPRTWKMFQDVIDLQGGVKNMDDKDLRSVAISCLGSEAATAFMTWIETKSSVTADDIINNLDKVKAEVKKMRYDASRGQLADVVSFITKQDEFYLLDKQGDDAATLKIKKARRENVTSYVFDILTKSFRDLGVAVLQKFKAAKRTDVMTILKKENPKMFTELISAKVAEAATAAAAQ